MRVRLRQQGQDACLPGPPGRALRRRPVASRHDCCVEVLGPGAARRRGPHAVRRGRPGHLRAVAGAETEVEGWIVPGLVDAHCHLGLDDDGAISDEETEPQAIEDRDAGALLIRDCGSAADTAWIHDREDLPRLIRAGRHIARTKRYIRNYAHEVEPGELTEYVAQEAQRGDGWVKLVGDWISRDEGDLAPSFPAEAFAAAIATAHEHGARVTAHCFGETVLPGLIEAGIDCIEHGTGLSQDLIDAMVEKRISLVPTVMQIDKFPEYVEAAGAQVPGVRRAHDRPARAAAGHDHGGVRRRRTAVRRLRRRRDQQARQHRRRGDRDGRARDAGGVRARGRVVAGQGVAGLERGLDEGAPADFVVYDSDPRADLSVLRRPSRVVLRGRVVAGR